MLSASASRVSIRISSFDRCEGGCVGGPKRNQDISRGTEYVDRYVEEAAYRTPGENPYAIDLIQRLGYETVEDFVKNSKILTREV